MKKIIKYFILIIFLQLLPFHAFAGSDGTINISKNNKPVKDCFEKINRATFALNQGLDKAIFKPIAKGYNKLPTPIKNGSSNFVSNISNLVTIPNNILQGDFKSAGTNTLRLIINTTLGIVGLYDAAEAMGLQKLDKEDYGQTLGKAGIGPGCYLVLPVLGPSTVRDTLGSIVNLSGGDPFYNITVKNDTHYFSEPDYYSTRVTNALDFRAKNLGSLDNLEKNSVDFYAAVRSLYLQDRQKKIANNSSVTETMDNSDWEEIEEN
tara:strand:+ start:60 stop:851 length:792 start_codon:yes stop_codon:yes gene_type:complete